MMRITGLSVMAMAEMLSGVVVVGAVGPEYSGRVSVVTMSTHLFLCQVGAGLPRELFAVAYSSC